MKQPPQAVVEKARRLAELLDRVERGEPSEQVSQALGLTIRPEQLTVLRQKYQASGGDWQVLQDGRYGHDQKASEELKAWLYGRKQGQPNLTAPKLVEEIKAKFEVDFSAGHVNYLLRKVALTRPAGRPRVRPQAEEPAPPVEPVSLPQAGLFFPGSSEGGAGFDRADRKGLEPEPSEGGGSPLKPSPATVEPPSRNGLG